VSAISPAGVPTRRTGNRVLKHPFTRIRIPMQSLLRRRVWQIAAVKERKRPFTISKSTSAPRFPAYVLMSTTAAP